MCVNSNKEHKHPLNAKMQLKEPRQQHSSSLKIQLVLPRLNWNAEVHAHVLRCCELAGLTSEFVQLSIDGVHNEHVWSLVARSYRGADQGQRPAGLLALPLLVDKVVQLAQIGIQEEVPAEEDTHGGLREGDEWTISQNRHTKIIGNFP